MTLTALNLDLEDYVVLYFNTAWCDSGFETQTFLNKIASDYLKYNFYFIDPEIQSDIHITFKETKYDLPKVVPSILIKKGNTITEILGVIDNNKLKAILDE